MNLEEAQEVADIISMADGGCSHCVFELRDMLQKAFPEFVWGEATSSDDLANDRRVIVTKTSD